MSSIWGQALSLSPLPVLGVGIRGLLPTFRGCGCAGAGADIWELVCVVVVVSVCLRRCLVMRCVPWCRGLGVASLLLLPLCPPLLPSRVFLCRACPGAVAGGGAPRLACIPRPGGLLF